MTTTTRLEHLCEVMHDAYERAAVGAGWETQTASRKPWADVPETNKATMRAAVSALLVELDDDAPHLGLATTRELTAELAARFKDPASSAPDYRTVDEA